MSAVSARAAGRLHHQGGDEATPARMARRTFRPPRPGRAAGSGPRCCRGLLRCCSCAGTGLSRSITTIQLRRVPHATVARSTGQYGTGGSCQHIAGRGTPTLHDRPGAGGGGGPAALEVSWADAGRPSRSRRARQAMAASAWRARYAGRFGPAAAVPAAPSPRTGSSPGSWKRMGERACRGRTTRSRLQRSAEEQPATPDQRPSGGDPGPGRDDLPRSVTHRRRPRQGRRKTSAYPHRDITVNVAGSSELVDVPSPGGRRAPRPQGQAVQPRRQAGQLSYFRLRCSSQVTGLAAEGL